MIKKLNILLFLSVFLFAGCLSNMPRITMGPSEKKETQPKVEALLHWQEMAVQLAEELVQKKDIFQEGQKLYVQKSEYETPFAVAFYKFVLSAFHDRGIPVTNNPDNELTLTFNVQNVRHEKEEVGGAARVVEDFGIILTGTSGNTAGREAEEILVFTALSNTEEDVFVLSQIAYINRNESHFYLEKKIEKPKSLGTKNYRVINEKENI